MTATAATTEQKGKEGDEKDKQGADQHSEEKLQEQLAALEEVGE